MEIFQQRVKESLQFLRIYNYHPVDWNANYITQHWSNPKDADFIVCNYFGQIGWIEAKNTSDKRFYASKLEKPWWERAKDLQIKYKSFYFVVNFTTYQKAYWLTPADLLPQESFDPQIYSYREIPLIYQESAGYFGKKSRRSYLNLLVIPLFSHATTKETLVSPT